MNSITLLSPAKVNLFLKVLGKRKDGYHEIITLFHRISLTDQITIKKVKRQTFILITNHPKLKNPKENLIYKAYCLLREAASFKEGIEVRLKKNIPIAAGLGGGSSNAAFFLLGINKLFGLGLSQSVLVKIGKKLGADIPFFIYNVNQALGTGIGEALKPVPIRRKTWFVLVSFPFGLSTPEVYRKLRAVSLTRISADATITSAFLKKLRSGDFPLENDLFQPASQIKPQLKRFDALFDHLGVRKRLMSGSGPTMFSLHQTKHEAERIAALIQTRKPSAKVFVCHTC